MYQYLLPFLCFFRFCFMFEYVFYFMDKKNGELFILGSERLRLNNKEFLSISKVRHCVDPAGFCNFCAKKSTH